LHLLAKEISKFNEIAVFDTTQLYGKMGKYRCLQFSDDCIQGAIDLKDLNRVVLEYARTIIHLMELNNPSFNNVFVVGHGIGTIASHYPDKRFTVAEIDEKVVELSKMFFGYRMDNVIVGDGRQILKNEGMNVFDYIIIDAYSNKGTPLHFTTLEFFKLTLEKLNSQGAIIMNLMGKPKNDRRLSAIHMTLRQSYAYSKAFSLPAVKEADIRNIIVIGSNKPIDFQVQDSASFFEVELGQGHLIMDSDPKRIPFST
jgi:spermidine synthase